ncbi:MAG: DUF1289 domain-containing protein [Methylococcaceae bacterium]|nr:DUF1289 domain-containing protein [Methylococcaceae bacterium]
MKFKPCISGLCTEEGTHCEGCGRSHEEIAETKSLVMGLVNFAQKQDYDNVEEFVSFVGKNVVKKIQNP